MAVAVTIKNIPSSLYDLLKKKASENRRSINSEIIAIIENSVLSRKISPDNFLTSARRLREKTKEHVLSEDFINRAKSAGRP